jgi:hypothetical protein
MALKTQKRIENVYGYVQQWLERSQSILFFIAVSNIGFCAAKLRRYSAPSKCER